MGGNNLMKQFLTQRKAYWTGFADPETYNLGDIFKRKRM